MLWQLNQYVFLMLLAGFVSAVVAYLTWRRRPAPGSTALVVVNAAGAIWAWTTALELTAGSLADASLFHKLSFIAIEVIGPALFVFAAEYTGHERWVTPRRLGLLAVVPVVSLVLIATSSFHTFFWQALTLDTSGHFAFPAQDARSVVVGGHRLHLCAHRDRGVRDRGNAHPGARSLSTADRGHPRRDHRAGRRRCHLHLRRAGIGRGGSGAGPVRLGGAGAVLGFHSPATSGRDAGGPRIHHQAPGRQSGGDRHPGAAGIPQRGG